MKNAGKHPMWGNNEIFLFPIATFQDEVKMSAYDQDLIYDDFLGMNVFKVLSL